MAEGVQGLVQGSRQSECSDDERVVWCTLMMLADDVGAVRHTLAELAAEASVDSCDAEPMTIEQVQSAISRFGARLEPLDPIGSGWRIVRFAHYRMTGPIAGPDADAFTCCHDGLAQVVS